MVSATSVVEAMDGELPGTDFSANVGSRNRGLVLFSAYCSMARGTLLFWSYNSAENVLANLLKIGRNKVLLNLMVTALIAMSPGPVWAHQFGLVFVAPLSGENAEQGKQALDGLMFATEEEDAHDFEESDGHLGGLDSYVFTLDSALEENVILEQLENIIRRQQPAFITGIFDANTVQLLGHATTGKNVVLFNPDESVMWQTIRGSPQFLATVNGQKFSSTMQKKLGYLPGADAYRGYIAARLISVAVRSLAQNPVDNIHATAKAVKQAQKLP